MNINFKLFKGLTQEEKDTINNCPPLQLHVKEIENTLLPQLIGGELTKDEFMELVMDMLDISEIEKNIEGIVLRDKILTAINSMIAIAKMM